MNETDTKNIKNITKRSVISGVAGIDHGRIQPQAVDLEQSLLGAIMLEGDAISSVLEILHIESFYKPAHQSIYEAMLSLYEKQEPIDILTVTHELKTMGQLDVIGGPYYIATLTNRVGSAGNIEFHARIIAEKYLKRELIRISGETINLAFEDGTDAFDALDKTEKNLFDLSQGNLKRGNEKMQDLVRRAIQEIDATNNEDGISGVPSGFHDIDNVTAGWQKSNLVIVAARPGMGKTAFALSMMRNTAVKFKKPVAFFSLEMSAIELVNRLIGSETGISPHKMKQGNLSDEEWNVLHNGVTDLSESPIYIDDTPGLSIFEFRAKARRLKHRNNIQLIIVDYLQLMTAGGDSKTVREQEISTISRSLKAIAKELDIPIIALAQLSREVEKRGGEKKPLLSDLRESGAIEQDADLVSFIYRPEYYGITQDEQGNPTDGLAQLLIEKHRNGANASINLRFVGHLSKFLDYNQNLEPDYASSSPEQSKIMPSLNWDNADDGNFPLKNDKSEDDAPFG